MGLFVGALEDGVVASWAAIVVCVRLVAVEERVRLAARVAVLL